MKPRGFTMIEVMIVIATIGIALMIFAPILFGYKPGNVSTQGSTQSWGMNGMVEIRCINGIEVLVSNRGEARQVMDEFGKGKKC